MYKYQFLETRNGRKREKRKERRGSESKRKEKKSKQSMKPKKGFFFTILESHEKKLREISYPTVPNLTAFSIALHTPSNGVDGLKHHLSPLSGEGKPKGADLGSYMCEWGLIHIWA